MKHLLKTNKNFRNFILSLSITRIGDYIDDIAFAQLIYLISESTLITSYVFAIIIILTFLSIFTATYVDRSNKKNILMSTSLSQGLLLFIILILYKFELINVPILIIFVTIQTVFSTFSVPANNSLLPNIVTDEEILTAQSTINILTQFIQISAYVFAGFIIKLLGIGGAILIDAFTFIIATLIIKKVNINNTNIQKISSTKEFLNNVKDGFYFVLKNKNILAIMIVTFFGNMFTSPVDSLMPAYFLQSKYTESAYSTFMLGITSGGIIGGICLSKIQKKLSNNKLLALGFAFGALGMVSLYYNISIIPYISAVLIGISYGVVSIMNAAILQLETPKDMVAEHSVFLNVSHILLAQPV